MDELQQLWRDDRSYIIGIMVIAVIACCGLAAARQAKRRRNAEKWREVYRLRQVHAYRQALTEELDPSQLAEDDSQGP
ncbi:MAG: hypothetical protein KDB36_11680 [Acidimicrobiales bacterium]|nr:hypothetical protein [Acidimicrobiales bacterium]